MFYPIKLPPTLHILPLARNPYEERTLLSRSRQAPKLARRVRIELTQQDLESRSPALGHASALKIGTPGGERSHDPGFMRPLLYH